MILALTIIFFFDWVFMDVIVCATTILAQATVFTADRFVIPGKASDFF